MSPILLTSYIINERDSIFSDKTQVSEEQEEEEFPLKSFTNMLNNQDFMEPRLRNEVGSRAVKDQEKNDEERLIDGLKWSYDYFDHDQTDIHHQIVPEIHKEDDEEEVSTKDLLVVVVPDEHSETGDHHQYHGKDYSDSSDSLWSLSNNHQKPKRRRIQISTDDESEGFTREVPSVTRKVTKRRRREEMMSNKMRTLQQLVPNCHKMDSVSVLDKTIEYMKNLQLQLQLQVMSIMGMNLPYTRPATLDFGIHHHLLPAMAMAQGLNPANLTTFSPSIPMSNWLLPPFSNLSFPYTNNQSLLASPASSPQCLCSLVPCFPIFPTFSPYTIGRL